MPKQRFIAGLDDAGRGPVLGPMVIAGLKISEDNLAILKQIGVKDSKELSPHQREKLFEKLTRIADRYNVIKITPKTIDHYVKMSVRPGGLNLLEAKAMARIIVKLHPDIAYVDASDVNPDRFCEWIRLDSQIQNVEIISENHADRKYPVVSGASILAKVIRDKEINQLKNIYGDFGSGYVSDIRTLNFLKQFYVTHGSFPPIARKSWKTLKQMESEIKQSTLN